MRKLILLLLLAFLTTGVVGISYAQDVKTKKEKKHDRKEKKRKDKADKKAAKKLSKMQHRELKKKVKEDHKKAKREHRQKKKKGKGDEAKAAIVNKNKPIIYQQSKLKYRYRIDVLAQLYLDEIKNNKIPEKGLHGIDFYEGINVAADTLKKSGFNIDIYVHDVASANESTEMLLKKNLLDSTDLIIGAVPARDVPALAEYAGKNHVNFISALSPADGGVRDNPYFTLMQPSLKSHCAWIANDVAKKFPGMKVGLLYRTSSPADSSAYNYVVNGAIESVSFKPLLCNSLPKREELAAIFDSVKPNVVVVPILEYQAADSLLKELSRDFPATHFEVYGMPSWSGITNLRREQAFPNLSVDVTMPFNIDHASPVVQYVSSMYKKDYGGVASEYVYRGFEAMFWYANLLKNYGTIFNEQYSDNTAAPFTKFDVKPQWDKNGNVLFNENIHIFVSRYEGGSYKTE